MLPKHKERQQAIYLRTQGKSYSEILSSVLVSKSTLSLWLKNVPLTKHQIRELLLRKKIGQSKGALSKKNFRIKQQEEIIRVASKQIRKISLRELFLLGIVAYWCEGAKQKENNVSQGVVFANSDPFLIKLFLKWLKNICLIGNDQILYSLCIHESVDSKSALEYWSKLLNVQKEKFGKTILKKHKISRNRKNTGSSYYGLIRVSVKKSTNLNRKISGWISGINNFLD